MNGSRRLWIAVPLAVLAVVGYTAARSVLGGVRGSTLSRTAATPATTASSARMPAPDSRADGSGEPSAAERSPGGALATAVGYLRLLDEASTSADTTRRLDAITVAPLTGRALAAEAVSAALERRVSESGPAFVRGWRLGYRVDSYTPSSAQVAVWAMGMVQSPHEVLAPQYSTTLCSVRWAQVGWRVLAARTTSGPTPPLDGSDPAAVSAFVHSASAFQAFGDAP